MSKPLYDCLIIGGGPAGLASATTLARLRHTALVFDSGLYRNARARHMHGVIGWDHRNPAELRARAREDLRARYPTIDFRDAEVREVRRRASGGFEAVDASGEVFAGKKLCLATGVTDVFPDIEGYGDCWARGIFHCLVCHGYEEGGQASAGLFALPQLDQPAMVFHVANMALRHAGKVTIYTHGDAAAAAAALTEAMPAKAPRITVDSRRIAKLAMESPSASRVTMTFEDGSSATEGFIAHAPAVSINGPFAEQLGLELAPTGFIQTSPPFHETSVPGVFACGDAAQMMRTVAAGAAMGIAAGAGVAAQVSAEELRASAEELQ